ncbi:MAG: ATP-binding cassette domain-containing protein [Candidatus Bipolaricaulaceae bacterium]
MAEQNKLVEMLGIHKWFGAVHALKGVDFTVMPGEIIGLIGDNGAGKSTLIKILAGVYPPDRGKIKLNGQEVRFRHPKDAQNHGIATVYQELALVDTLDVAGNIFLGREPARVGREGLLAILSRAKMRELATKILESLRIEVSVTALVGELSGGQRQAVAISRALHQQPKLVIMDEPTAALAVQEATKVLELMRALKHRGLSVIFISHTLPEVFAVADRIVVLRKGEKVADCMAADLTIDEAIKLMVG